MSTRQSIPAQRQSPSPASLSLGLDLGRQLTTPNLLALSLVIQLALVLYANHVDSHPERYGGLKYTDVDWRVVTDGAKLIFGQGGGGGGGGSGKRAEGWFIDDTGLPVGDPYERATFRYTPLLPLLLSSAVIHDLLGKITLILISLLVTPLLLASGSPFWPTHLIWTLNPFVISITTRGSPEAIIIVLVIMLLVCLKNAHQTEVEAGGARKDEAVVWWTFAAITLGVAVSWKIYPVIYVPAIWALLAEKHGWWGGEVWWFGTVTAATLVLVNWPLWSIWGQPFLDHTFLYHLTRLDHRHNFSPYFYQIYLSLFPAPGSDSTAQLTNGAAAGTGVYAFIGRWVHENQNFVDVLGHPLVSFLPQVTVVGFAGLTLPKRVGIEGTMFFQTALFVVFNKVVTSQYFIWFLPLLPPIIPSLNLSFTRSTILALVWVGAQAIWLGMGYILEFMGQSVYLGVWAAGLGLFGASCWILGELLDSYDR